MEKFKDHWEIKQNWQLLFPLLGTLILGYLSFKFVFSFLKDVHFSFTTFTTILVFIILLKFILFLFKKLETKWKVSHKWEMISIFLVFATTGSSSVYVAKPIIKFIGITKENLNPFAYWVLYIIIGFIFYQILLVLIGWLFGQFKFFSNFEKKMIRRFGLKRFVD
ncbi:DUF6787 family protein [Yeosuana marina]|uniref:DUF6787 family protein n=1 Tax=Yeosuana marina TaxID=1565536 RepID=UPI0030C7CE90